MKRLVFTLLAAVVFLGCQDAATAPQEPVASVTVSPDAATVVIGGMVQLEASLTDHKGRLITNRDTRWSSADETIATVDATGLVTGVGTGVVTITAESERQTGTAAITVVQFLGLTQWNTGPGANGHWYAITEAAGDFRDIKALAVSLGGTLVSITSAAENEFVYNNFVALGTCAPVWCQPATFYIGLERVSSGGPFAWLTGEPLVFTAWNTGEPNDAGDERVAHMFKVREQVLWNDISFTSNPMRGVIEWTEDPRTIIP